MNKVTLSNFKKVLISEDVFLAHCASFSTFVGNEITSALGFYEKIGSALSSKDIEVACSTIGAGDYLHTDNYTGPAGLIIWPIAPDSLTAAGPCDLGTEISTTVAGRRTTIDWPAPSLDDVRNAIVGRAPNKYNELCVWRYRVLGIFAESRFQFLDKNNLPEDGSIEEIFRRFPNEEIYELKDGELFRRRDKQGQIVNEGRTSIDSLYSRVTTD